MTNTNQKLREALQAIANIDDATNHSVDASAALDRIGQIARQALALPTAEVMTNGLTKAETDASMTVPAPEAGSESKIVIDVGPGGSGGGPAEAAPPATEQTAPAPAQESAITGEADVWHEGSKSFYRATLLHKLTPEDVFSEPPELDAYTQPAQEVGLTDEERADMACAVAAICTGTSSRTVAATAIEWTERALRAKGQS